MRPSLVSCDTVGVINIHLHVWINLVGLIPSSSSLLDHMESLEPQEQEHGPCIFQNINIHIPRIQQCESYCFSINFPRTNDTARSVLRVQVGHVLTWVVMIPRSSLQVRRNRLDSHWFPLISTPPPPPQLHFFAAHGFHVLIWTFITSPSFIRRSENLWKRTEASASPAEGWTHHSWDLETDAVTDDSPEDIELG